MTESDEKRPVARIDTPFYVGSIEETLAHHTTVERSPIVNPENMPPTLKTAKLPKKKELSASLISKESLLEEMTKAGGKNLSTHQFALLIAPCVKRSVDPVGHHRWDQSHSHIRNLMRKLAAEGKIKMERDESLGKLRYVYNIVE